MKCTGRTNSQEKSRFDIFISELFTQSIHEIHRLNIFKIVQSLERNKLFSDIYDLEVTLAYLSAKAVHS